jgi:hypothetical protein
MSWAFDRLVFWDDKNVLLLYCQGSWDFFNEYPMRMYDILRLFLLIFPTCKNSANDIRNANPNCTIYVRNWLYNKGKEFSKYRANGLCT